MRCKLVLIADDLTGADEEAKETLKIKNIREKVNKN